MKPREEMPRELYVESDRSKFLPDGFLGERIIIANSKNFDSLLVEHRLASLLISATLLPATGAAIHESVFCEVLLSHVFNDEVEVGEPGIDAQFHAARVFGRWVAPKEIETMLAPGRRASQYLLDQSNAVRLGHALRTALRPARS